MWRDPGAPTLPVMRSVQPFAAGNVLSISKCRNASQRHGDFAVAAKTPAVMTVIGRFASQPNLDTAADLYTFLDSAAIHDRADRVDVRAHGILLAMRNR